MILILFSVLFIVVYVFILSSSNPYTLTMIFGKKGSGKTSDIAKQVLYYTRKGYKCYANLKVVGAEYYNPRDIGRYTFEPNSVVFCDEIGLIWNNRDFKEFEKCVRSWFKYQRQYKIKMIVYSQAFDIDKQLRDLTDKMYIIVRLGKLSIKRPIYKKIGISKDLQGNGTLVDCYSYGFGFSGWKVTYLPRYFGLFDSFNPPNLPLIKSTLVQSNEVSEVYSSTKTYLIYRLHIIYEKVLLFSSTIILSLKKKIKGD